MEIISIGMDQELVVEILISNVRVKRTISVFVTYTDKQHHGISADILAIKWEIGLDKVKWTLQSTTQDNVISALKSLTLWYRIDFPSQRLSVLNS